MDNFNTLSVDSKAVKYAFLNGKLVYTSLINSSTPNWALENVTLSVATLSGPDTYLPPGDTTPYSYYTYKTSLSAMTAAGSGSNHLIEISPKVFCRAKHYNTTVTTFYGPRNIPCTAKEQIGLVDWAKANGHEDLIPGDADVSDIEMIYSQYRGDTSNLPYLMPWKQYQAMFHSDTLSGQCGWMESQVALSAGYATPATAPVVFGADIDGKLMWSTPNKLSAIVPAGEQYDFIRELNPTYLGTTGDSGRPVFLQIGSKQVLVSHNWQIYKPAFGGTAPYQMLGPNYCKAYDLLKAYVESKGETIKTLPTT